MLFAGFVVGILMHATGGWGASFFYFPGGIWSIVWYIIFFMCGCVAKRGQWIESVDKLPHLNIAVCGLLVMLLACTAWRWTSSKAAFSQSPFAFVSFGASKGS